MAEDPAELEEQKSPAVDPSQGEETKGEETIAGGAEAPVEEEKKGYWPEDWRDRIATERAGEDEKARARILKQLERYSDPASVYGKASELEKIFSEGNLIRKPGEDATDEEKARYREVMGIPKEQAEYVTSLQLPEGVDLGDDDRPVADAFAEVAMNSSMSKEQYNDIVNWYYQQQEKASEAQDEFDDEFKVASQNELKEEYGGAYKRNLNSIAAVFPYWPGGKEGLAAVLGGRTAGGNIIGDDPNFVRALVNMAKAINPTAAVVDDVDMSGKGVDEEIKEIETLMRTDRRAYNKDEAKQARYRELLDARERMRARQSAA